MILNGLEGNELAPDFTLQFRPGGQSQNPSQQDLIERPRLADFPFDLAGLFPDGMLLVFDVNEQESAGPYDDRKEE